MFKVGDRVVCVRANPRLVHGQKYTVKEVLGDFFVAVDNDPVMYRCDRFRLVASQPNPEPATTTLPLRAGIIELRARIDAAEAGTGEWASVLATLASLTREVKGLVADALMKAPHATPSAQESCSGS